MEKNTAHQNKNPEQPDADAQVEVIGYKTDPLRRGYQILWNYESTYWRAYVGNDVWSYYEVLRSFCHDKNPDCKPSTRFLADILGLADYRQLTGRFRGKGEARRFTQGLMDKLQESSLAVVTEVGEGPELRYRYHVNLTLPQLTEDQLIQLPERLQRKHAELLKRCEKAKQELEDGKRLSKEQKESQKTANKMGEDMDPGGADQVRPPPGPGPPRTLPI